MTLTSKTREAIEQKAGSDGSFAIAAAILTLADAVEAAGPPASVRALDLSFVQLSEAVRDAGQAVSESLDQTRRASEED